MDHFIFCGGNGQLPKKNPCTAKVEKKKLCKASSLTHSQARLTPEGKKKLSSEKLLNPKWSIPNATPLAVYFKC